MGGWSLSGITDPASRSELGKGSKGLPGFYYINCFPLLLWTLSPSAIPYTDRKQYSTIQPKSHGINCRPHQIRLRPLHSAYSPTIPYACTCCSRHPCDSVRLATIFPCDQRTHLACVQHKSHPQRPFSTRTSGYTNWVALYGPFSSLKETCFEFDVELQCLLKTEVKYNAFIEASGKPQCLHLRSCTHHTGGKYFSTFL